VYRIMLINQDKSMFFYLSLAFSNLACNSIKRTFARSADSVLAAKCGVKYIPHLP